jgi:hypothetical protein
MIKKKNLTSNSFYYLWKNSIVTVATLQQQNQQQQNKQEISIIRTNDPSFGTPIKELIKLDEIIIEPEEKLLIADFMPCKISNDKVTFNIIINTTLQ